MLIHRFFSTIRNCIRQHTSAYVRYLRVAQLPGVVLQCRLSFLDFGVCVCVCVCSPKQTNTHSTTRRRYLRVAQLPGVVLQCRVLLLDFSTVGSGAREEVAGVGCIPFTEVHARQLPLVRSRHHRQSKRTSFYTPRPRRVYTRAFCVSFCTFVPVQ